MSEFEHLGLQQWLARQCAYMALHHPTPIQSACIPPALAGKHIVGGAATGSGKTAAFALPILQRLSADMYGVFALVLTPSRELAYQIVDQFIAFGAPLKLRTMLAIGGVPHNEQVSLLQGRPHVVVATPGRLLYLLDTFAAEVMPAFRNLRFLVLDEADRLTEGDMQRDVREILGRLRPTPRRQAMLFSATISPQLLQVSGAPEKEKSKTNAADDADGEKEEDEEEEEESFLSLLGVRDSASVVVTTLGNSQAEQGTATGVTTSLPSDAAESASAGGVDKGSKAALYTFPATLAQTYLFMPDMVKLPHLVAALRAQGKEQSTIVFANSCHRAELVRFTLQLLGFPVCSLDSLLSQKSRLDNLALFKLRIARIMVATDIAARGLDIPAVGLVIHYDVPKHAETYVHRVGRTARAGRPGLSVALVTEYDVELVQRIERKTRVRWTLWGAKTKTPRQGAAASSTGEEGERTDSTGDAGESAEEPTAALGRPVRERDVLKVLEEVSAAKIQAKQLVDEQFGERARNLKAQASLKKRHNQERIQQQQQQRQHRNRQQSEDPRRPVPSSRRGTDEGTLPVSRPASSAASSLPPGAAKKRARDNHHTGDRDPSTGGRASFAANGTAEPEEPSRPSKRQRKEKDTEKTPKNTNKAPLAKKASPVKAQKGEKKKKKK